MRRELMGTLFVLLGLALWAVAVPAAPLAGTVVAVSGSSTDHGRVLTRGDAVQVGDTLAVPAGSHLLLRMADGSVIAAAPDSSMTVANYSIGVAGRYVRLVLAQGLLRVRVPPVGGRSTFEVSTAAGIALVRSRSADWFVRVQAGVAQVGVLEGTVDLTSAATRRSVSIPSEWGTRLEVGLDVMPPRRWGKTDFNPVIALTECCGAAQPRLERGIGPETQ